MTRTVVNGQVIELISLDDVPYEFLRAEVVVDMPAVRCAVREGVTEIPGFRIRPLREGEQ